MKYDELAKQIWRKPDSMPENASERLKEIVRLASLAPSSHNTQCWLFHIKDDMIVISPDFSRRCSVVDPDDHHLYASLGCAVENLVIAARAYGLAADVRSETPQEGIQIYLAPCYEEKTPLFNAITNRQCTRTLYDGNLLSEEELELLKKAGTGDEVSVLLLTDQESKAKVTDHITRANAAQIDNKEFVKELKAWIRANEHEAVTTGDGLSGKAIGAPSLPRWLFSFIFNFAFQASSENSKIEKQMKSSAGVAIFVSAKDDPVHWVEAGRCYERFALQATALGVRNAFLNQPVEVAEMRPKFAAVMNLKESSRPDLIVRFGKGGEMPHSLRRPLESIMQ